MPAARLPLGVLLAVAACGSARAQTHSPSAAKVPLPTAVPEIVAPAYKDAVAKVMKSPTVTARAAEEAFAASPTVYQWLLDHPDRTSWAWQRLQVPCVEITDLGNGRFHWADEGSELTWQAVGRPADGVIWYATGKVKPGTLLPTVPVRAVAVLKCPQLQAAGGKTHLRPEVAVYIQTDSRAANAVLRMAGPAAPKLAEQGAEQFLYFFSGIARYLHKHPDQVAAVLGPKPGK